MPRRTLHTLLSTLCRHLWVLHPSHGHLGAVCNRVPGMAPSSRRALVTVLEAGSGDHGGQQAWLLLSLAPRRADGVLPMRLHVLFICACLCPVFLFVQGHQTCWIRAHPNDLISP